MIRIRRTIAVLPLRVCALACVLLGAVASSAAADQRSAAAVEKLVRAHVAASITTERAFLATLTDDAHITTPEGGIDIGALACTDEPDPCDASFNIYERASSIFGTYKYGALGKPAIYVDDANHVAFFQVAVKLSVDGSRGEEMDVDVRGKTTMRITGLATERDGAWKVAAVAYAPSLSEQRLLALAERTKAHRFAPADAVTKEVAGWVGHLAAHISPHAIGAAGTAPKELATKPAAMTQLAQRWDQLPLDLTFVSAVTRGDAAMVWGTAWRKVGDKVVRLIPTILVERDGGSWRWVAISWEPYLGFEQALAR